jgi:lipopolysaccharide/colanic/teichoic acid biosynthesis glycosyltransferase
LSIRNQSPSANMQDTSVIQSSTVDDVFRPIQHRNGTRLNLTYLLREFVVSSVFLIIFNVVLIFIPRRMPQGGLLVFFVGKARYFIKRGIDIVFSIIGLMLTAPLFLLLGILIKVSSPGPVIFKQERIGRNRRSGEGRILNIPVAIERRKGERRRKDKFGRPFNIYKFRTMVQDAEKDSGPIWARKGDSRVTRLGKILRTTRLDEIPQFLNVLLGDMSLVGPRPERYHFILKIAKQVEGYPERLSLNPGITGLAQIKSGYASSLESSRIKIQYDLSYAKNWSISKDLHILLQTVFVVITGKGAV